MVRLLAVSGALGISFSAIFVRLAEVSPSTASFFRAFYALPLLVVLFLAGRRRDRRTPRMRAIALASGFFLAVDLAFWHRSIAHIGTGLSTVLANTQVVFVGLFAWLFYRERPTWTARLLIPVIFGGVALSSGLGRADAYGERPLLGAGLGVAAGLSYSGFLLLFRRANRLLAPPAGPLLEATCGLAGGALITGLIEPAFDLSVHLPAHLWLIALSLFTHTGGWLLIAVSLPRLPALETSVILLLQPVFTMLWGYLFFEEVLSAAQLAGAAVILAGVGVLSARGSVVPSRVAE